MAFVDFYAAGGAPVGSLATMQPAQARAWAHPPASPVARKWWRATPAVIGTMLALAAPAIILGRYFDDGLLGALFALLLYAAASPMAAWLGSDRSQRRWTSY